MKNGADIQVLNSDGYNAHDATLQPGVLSIAAAVRFALKEAWRAEAEA